MRAWEIEEDGSYAFYLAKTPLGAQRQHMLEWDYDLMDDVPEPTRCPAMDDLEPTPLNAFRAGVITHTECVCGAHIEVKENRIISYDDNEEVLAFTDGEGDVWCSQECYQEHGM